MKEIPLTSQVRLTKFSQTITTVLQSVNANLGPLATTGKTEMDLRVTPRLVQSQVVSKLREAILSGHFKPGERLVESTLCQMINVSRSSLREALRRLEGEKLILNMPNKGPSVAEISWVEAEEIYNARILLEAEAVAQFTKRVTDHDILRMRAALRELFQAIENDDPVERLRATNEFYGTIFGNCGNSIIGGLLESLQARITLLRTQNNQPKSRARDGAKEMNEILKMIEKRNSAAARKAAIAHVRAAWDGAKRLFPRNDKTRSPGRIRVSKLVTGSNRMQTRAASER
jgi:DNA-binding GntR family transcriptional regulator